MIVYCSIVKDLDMLESNKPFGKPKKCFYRSWLSDYSSLTIQISILYVLISKPHSAHRHFYARQSSKNENYSLNQPTLALAWTNTQKRTQKPQRNIIFSSLMKFLLLLCLQHDDDPKKDLLKTENIYEGKIPLSWLPDLSTKRPGCPSLIKESCFPEAFSSIFSAGRVAQARWGRWHNFNCFFS